MTCHFSLKKIEYSITQRRLHEFLFAHYPPGSPPAADKEFWVGWVGMHNKTSTAFKKIRQASVDAQKVNKTLLLYEQGKWKERNKCTFGKPPFPT